MSSRASRCCENPKRTTSVSTRKGRRIICNNCGTPWKKPVSKPIPKSVSIPVQVLPKDILPLYRYRDVLADGIVIVGYREIDRTIHRFWYAEEGQKNPNFITKEQGMYFDFKKL